MKKTNIITNVTSKKYYMCEAINSPNISQTILKSPWRPDQSHFNCNVYHFMPIKFQNGGMNN